MSPCLLVVDDDAALNLALCAHFEDRGWQATGVYDCAAALVATAGTIFEGVLLDVQLPDGDGVELLGRLLERDPHLPVILMTGGRDVERAMQAIAAGAFDWLPKPFEPAELERLVDRAQAARQATVAGAAETDDAPLRTLVGESRALLEIGKTLARVAPSDTRVLITGESGTGKEVIARLVHTYSGRRGPFVAVNCAALVETLLESELFGHERGAFTGAHAAKPGKFEQAAEGTLFLDEVGELPPTVQAKLLRVLQEKELQRLGSPKLVKVDVRVIAATNRDLAKAVAEGRFREDLYYRLNVFPITVPPLRDRLEDVPLLVWTFVEEFSTAMGKSVETIAKASLRALQQYQWPGNVRELRNVIERAMILASGSTLKIDLPGAVVGPVSRSLSTLADAEREHIQRVLEATGGRIRGAGGAAEILGLKPTTLESRMAKLGLRRHPFNH